MAPRLSKRQQREQEELEALAGPSRLEGHSDHDQESEEEVPMTRGAPSAVSGFAALAADLDDDEIEKSSEEDIRKPVSKSKKKKKKKGVAPADQDPISQQKPSKGKKSKQDAKPQGKLKAQEDDFYKALAELSGKNSDPQKRSSGGTTTPSSSFDAFNSLISVSLKHLDPETELRRFFGSKVINSSTPAQKTARARASGRSHLVRPQQTWPPAHYRAGLFMLPLAPEEVSAKGTGIGPDVRERWWTFEANPRYKGTTYEFMQCVMGGDPQLFFNLLQEMPWHADTLLQTAEVFRHREEYSSAADFLSRALFAYERGFSAAFNLTTGIHRLDFDAVENRVFYLALSRNVADLNRRGTPRTAFEFARLLFALDPHTDPHGALLHLDCLALKAGQAKWLLDMWDTCDKIHALRESDGAETRFDVTIMPGWHWARALALFDTTSDDDKKTCTQALRDAILAYPSILPLLADKADISIPNELRKLAAFEIVTDYSPYRQDLPTSLIHLLSHIYAMRSASLWKQSPRAAWLSDTLKSLSAQLPAALDGPVPRARTRLCTLFSEQSNLTDAVYRHITVVAPLAPEFRRLTGFFPAEVKERLAHTIEGDPLPPVTATNMYGDAYFAVIGVESRSRSGNRLAAELGRVFPNVVDRRQFQALFDAHPEIGARFPGGVIELAQMARQFPQEVLDAMMAMVAGAEGGPAEGGERMPGGEEIFAEPVELHDPPAAADQGEEGDSMSERGEDEDEEEYDEPFLPVRIVQTLLGRLWGRNTQVDSDSDDADEGREPENTDNREGSLADDVD